MKRRECKKWMIKRKAELKELGHKKTHREVFMDCGENKDEII